MAQVPLSFALHASCLLVCLSSDTCSRVKHAPLELPLRRTSLTLAGLAAGGSVQQLTDAVPAAALLAAAAVASEAEAGASGSGGGGFSLGENELSALMATLMAR